MIEKVIWFALVISMFIYAYVVKLQTTGGESIPAPEDMTQILPVMAVISAVLSFVIPKYIEKQKDKHPILGVVANVVRWGLAESIVIYGLVLGFVTRDLDFFYPYLASGLVLMIIYFPKKRATPTGLS